VLTGGTLTSSVDRPPARSVGACSAGAEPLRRVPVSTVGTLLGPEGAGYNRFTLVALVPHSGAAPASHGQIVRALNGSAASAAGYAVSPCTHRPYLENCIVDASI
jgi:hypothetical protein